MAAIWQNALLEIWGIEGDLTQLDGEYDLNFAVSGDPGYILKVMRPGCEAEFIDMQCRAIAHLRRAAPELPVPQVIASLSGEDYVTLQVDEDERILWLQTRLPGRVYADFRPHSQSLIRSIGQDLGRAGKALRDFKHPHLQREFKWDLMQASWVKPHIQEFEDPGERAILESITSIYDSVLPQLQSLPRQAIHNDANDYNLLVEGGIDKPARLSGLLDFGDMCNAPRICDLAIAAAYIMLGQDNPEVAVTALVQGYHSADPISSEECDLLCALIGMRFVVSAVNARLMAREKPDDPYVSISQAPIWQVLRSPKVNVGLMSKRLRIACGMPVTDSAPTVAEWLKAERGNFAQVLGHDLNGLPFQPLSVEASAIPQNPFAMTTDEIEESGEFDGSAWYLGHYLEPRLIYTDMAFRLGPWASSNRRAMHLAIDVFAPAGTGVYAPCAARVFHAEYRDGNLDYGGVVVLEHEIPGGGQFFTLYGHLNPSNFENLKPGTQVAKGQRFAELGDPSCNGGWTPHVHFQVAMSTSGMGVDWPGVGDPDDTELWQEYCPNPAPLLNLPDEPARFHPVSKQAVSERREALFSPNLKLSYDEPVMFLRGWKHHLFDEWARPYLDAYNNVPHVGHAHPRIQAVAAEQLTRLNVNTRYLHPARSAFAETLLAKFPDGFDTCFFVNSGTEANELALRLARAHSGGHDMVTPDHGYHGNSTGAVDISAYKFNAPGGPGKPDWVELVELPDDYRGSFRRDDLQAGAKYAAQVGDALTRITARGSKPAGFIAETFPSVGGQIIPPEGYLQSVYAQIRAAGGLCIADEVQTGLGRLGQHYFGFEQQCVVPDIVVLGKPLGNGHPIGAVVTRREIAESFAQGPEFFSTFGGSVLSCRIGKEVLDIVDDEGLMENAQALGAELMAGLNTLAGKYELVGDIRGMGLFLGLDLVEDRGSRTPATAVAAYVKNRLRELRVLAGTEGPADNILKIRPPLSIDMDGVACILARLDQVLDEASRLTGRL